MLPIKPYNFELQILLHIGPREMRPIYVAAIFSCHVSWIGDFPSSIQSIGAPSDSMIVIEQLFPPPPLLLLTRIPKYKITFQILTFPKNKNFTFQNVKLHSFSIRISGSNRLVVIESNGRHCRASTFSEPWVKFFFKISPAWADWVTTDHPGMQVCKLSIDLLDCASIHQFNAS